MESNFIPGYFDNVEGFGSHAGKAKYGIANKELSDLFNIFVKIFWRNLPYKGSKFQEGSPILLWIDNKDEHTVFLTEPLANVSKRNQRISIIYVIGCK